MKQHNEDYEGKSVSIEVTANGFIITEHGLPTKKRVSKSFGTAVNMVAAHLGLLNIGEEIKVESQPSTYSEPS